MTGGIHYCFFLPHDILQSIISRLSIIEAVGDKHIIKTLEACLVFPQKLGVLCFFREHVLEFSVESLVYKKGTRIFRP
jgi:hypothetical protein